MGVWNEGEKIEKNGVNQSERRHWGEEKAFSSRNQIKMSSIASQNYLVAQSVKPEHFIFLNNVHMWKALILLLSATTQFLLRFRDTSKYFSRRKHPFQNYLTIKSYEREKVIYFLWMLSPWKIYFHLVYDLSDCKINELRSSNLTLWKILINT